MAKGALCTGTLFDYVISCSITSDQRREKSLFDLDFSCICFCFYTAVVSTYNMEFSITSLVYESSYDDVHSTQSQELMSVLSSMVRWPHLNFFASEAIFFSTKLWAKEVPTLKKWLARVLCWRWNNGSVLFLTVHIHYIGVNIYASSTEITNLLSLSILSNFPFLTSSYMSILLLLIGPTSC